MMSSAAVMDSDLVGAVSMESSSHDLSLIMGGLKGGGGMGVAPPPPTKISRSVPNNIG